MLRIIMLIFIAFVGAYGLLLGWVYLSQRSFQYFPSHVDKDGRGDGIFEPWRSRAGDFLGYVRDVKEPTAVLLFFHGNGGEAIERTWLAEIAPKTAVLLLAEYPGYGASGGSPTEESIFRLAELMHEEAVFRWKAPIVVLGESLGSGAACYLASRKPVWRIALISPFSSAVDVAAWHYSFLPVRLLMKDRFESMKYLEKVEIPLHIVHGTLDDLVPIALAKKLFKAYHGKEKYFTEIPGFAHNDLVSGLVDSPLAKPFVDFIRQ